MLPWLSDPEQRYEVASVIRHSVDRMFREHGIEIPFPQRDIHVKPSDSSLASATERGLEVRSSAGEVVSPADDTLRKAARTKAKRK
jgi:small-conductance mechanosensitive channel